jgi:glucose-6-phosphate 1-dehydrogenase
MVSDRASKTTVVILGASGDLTKRKLGPALFHLMKSDLLPDLCSFIGVARSELSDEQFHSLLREGIDSASDSEWAKFSDQVTCFQASSTDSASLKALDAQISAACGDEYEDDRIYYLALKPSLYPDTLLALSEAGSINETTGSRRVVIENRSAPTTNLRGH